MEFAGDRIMMCLAILLASGNGRGGGDLHSKNQIVGSWAGDQIVIAGDYMDPGLFLPPDITTEQLQKIATEQFSKGYQDPAKVNLYHLATETWTDISVDIVAALMEDEYIRGDWEREAETPGFDNLLKATLREAVKKYPHLKRVTA